MTIQSFVNLVLFLWIFTQRDSLDTKERIAVLLAFTALLTLGEGLRHIADVLERIVDTRRYEAATENMARQTEVLKAENDRLERTYTCNASHNRRTEPSPAASTSDASMGHTRNAENGR